jgi:hypothetical protein
MGVGSRVDFFTDLIAYVPEYQRFACSARGPSSDVHAPAPRGGCDDDARFMNERSCMPRQNAAYFFAKTASLTATA